MIKKNSNSNLRKNYFAKLTENNLHQKNEGDWLIDWQKKSSRNRLCVDYHKTGDRRFLGKTIFIFFFFLYCSVIVFRCSITSVRNHVRLSTGRSLKLRCASELWLSRQQKDDQSRLDRVLPNSWLSADPPTSPAA